MRERLSKERVLELFDYNDGKLYWKVKRKADSASTDNNRAGCKTSFGYRVISIDYVKYMEHRVVFIYHHGYSPNCMIDHIDGIKCNNKIGNLRRANRSENFCNSKIRIDNSSGIKGVHWNNINKNWRCKINKKGMVVFDRSFKELYDAKEAIEIARKKHHKEFANNG